MKLALYLHDLNGGGAERATLSLLKPLQHLGATVTLLLHRREGVLVDLVPSGVRVVAFETRRTINDLLPMAAYLRRERPDALVANLNHNNIVALLAKALVGSRTRVYICQHNALSRESARPAPLDYRVVPTLYRYLSPLAAGIIGVSNGVADDLARTSGIARQRITMIYDPAIDGDFAARLAEPIRHPWLNKQVPLFVTAGRLVPQKDPKTLLMAFAQVRQPSRLMILGTGPLRSSLEDLAQKLGIAERVCFTGFVTNPLPYIRAATAFVLSSAYEGFGIAIVEALGCGTPVISTDCPYGPAEILEDGKYGTLVPVGDVQAMTAAMDRLSTNPWSPDLLRHRAEVFSAENAAQDYFKLLTSQP
jgi:glycosyltransferase involved in cell wall biosynthesis